MEKRIKQYRKYIDELLLNENTDWKETCEEHLIQVSFFQHERLIHLIVTVLFAVLTIISMVSACILVSMDNSVSIMFLILSLALLVLLVPYIRHYYILENEVQKMYAQYDQLQEKSKRLN